MSQDLSQPGFEWDETPFACPLCGGEPLLVKYGAEVWLPTRSYYCPTQCHSSFTDAQINPSSGKLVTQKLDPSANSLPPKPIH